MADGGKITAWNADRVYINLRNQMVSNARSRAGPFLVGKIKQRISIQGPPPSSPGDPPHVDTGRLIASIVAIVSVGGFGGGSKRGDIALSVGSNLPDIYPMILEVGSAHMAARPYLRNTMAENGPETARLMTGK